MHAWAFTAVPHSVSGVSSEVGEEPARANLRGAFPGRRGPASNSGSGAASRRWPSSDGGDFPQRYPLLVCFPGSSTPRSAAVDMVPVGFNAWPTTLIHRFALWRPFAFGPKCGIFNNVQHFLLSSHC
ncbi:uncharacterized protein EI97DRAFT_23092 [Westerdykella ornata]|uniref:Uncharacterized protein n=1 Tax=Westerdykella ornata TaxID=318751 RepID=A0A6A6JX66_WESOR|nr:uncharacterized protein EI97DRAFT_23092 [Westerdykella ornata]KAF2281212.1 hypothetical protein EI97DRAFT_23092 [Westerdykella ornata]